MRPCDAQGIRAEAAPFRGIQALLGLTFAFTTALVVASSHAGWAFGVLIAVIVVGVNGFADVRDTFARAFAPDVGGVPIAWVVSAVELVFVVPAVVVGGDALFRLLTELRRRGDAVPTGAIGLAATLVAGVPHDLASARRRVVVAGGYLVALVAAWIGYAAAIGV